MTFFFKNEPMQPRITAQDFYDFHKCPHRVYLNRHGDVSEKLPHSEFLNLLFDNAMTHEWDVVKMLDCSTPNGGSLEERSAATIHLMTQGVERIYQGVLLLPNDSGIPDLLERMDGKSSLGDFYYVPVDIKAGTGYADPHSGRLREDYGMQLFHYGKLLSVIQNKFPLQGEILNRRRERITYELPQFESAYMAAKNEIRELVVGAKIDVPALCGECDKCQWWGKCEGELIASNDITLLSEIGRGKKKVLNEIGVRSIQDVVTFDFGSVKLKGIGEKTVQAMKRSAHSALTQRICFLSKPSIPNPTRKIYLDFEDDPTQDLIYLCGLWIEPPVRDLNYHGLFCTDESGEARIWKEFQTLCGLLSSEDYVVFHFSSYEKTKLAVLERKYGAFSKAPLELFKSRMVDLHPIVKQSVTLPVRGYGLKKIAPFVGLKYSASNAGGGPIHCLVSEISAEPERCRNNEYAAPIQSRRLLSHEIRRRMAPNVMMGMARQNTIRNASINVAARLRLLAQRGCETNGTRFLLIR